MPRHRPSLGGRPARFERLESRQLLATFTVTSNADSGAGTLRDAITQVDADTGTAPDTIDFAIGSGGLETIAVKTVLPAVTHPALIDGTSQPGTSTTPRIELNGSGAGGQGIGLDILAANSTVDGLVIDGFGNSGVGIVLGSNTEASGDDAVLGCFLGTNPAGTAASPDGVGIEVRSDHDTIGGTSATARNLISGNLTANLLLGGDAGPFSNPFSFNGAVVEGNLIGTDVTGGIALPGAGTAAVGIETYYVYQSANRFGYESGGPFAPTIGGTAAGAGNVIAGNPGDGIDDSGITGVAIEGNEIGVGLGGQAVGNGGDGVAFLGFRAYYSTSLYYEYNSTVGGTAAGQANTIADNAGAGVDIRTDPYGTAANVVGVAIRGNSIFGNAQGNIDFLGAARTPNTAPGAGVGPNRLQERPVITSAVASGGSVTIAGTLDSGVTTPFALDFFSSKPTTPVLAFGQAQAYLGSDDVISDASGHVAFTVTLPDAAYAAGDLFTATATDSLGDTSEVSDDYPDVEPPALADLSVTGSSSPSPVSSTGSGTLTFDVTNHGPIADPGVTLTLSGLPGTIALNGSATVGTMAVPGGEFTPIEVGTVAAGQTVVVTIGFEPVGGTTAAYTAVADAKVAGIYVDPTPANNATTATISVAAPPAPDLVIATSASPAPVPFGTAATFTITVTNGGNLDAQGVSIADRVPVGYVSDATSQGSAVLFGGVLTANLGTIAAGKSATLTVVADATTTAPVFNQGVVTSPTEPRLDGAYGESDPVVGGTPPPAPTLTVTFPASPPTVRAGNLFNFSIQVRNVGSADAPDVKLTADLPAGTTLDGHYGSDVLTGNVLTAVFPTIAAGGSAVLDLTATETASGPIPIGGTVQDLAIPDYSLPIFHVFTTNPAPADYSGIGRTDLAVYLPSIGSFAIRPANGGPDQIVPFGFAGPGQTIPVSGDYFGTGSAAIAAYLPSIGAFAIRPPSGPDVIVPFGFAGAGNTIPVSGDFLDDGITDVAAYLPSIASFVIRPDDGRPDEVIPFGLAGAGQTIPALGDYDGDGVTDVAAYLPSLGEFAIRPSSGGPDEIIPFGVAGSIPMPGDYDGSGKAELAVYMPSLGEFAYRPANGNPDVIEPFGFAGAGQTIPAPGDYDGDGRTDLAVYLPSVGAFAVRPSSGGSDQITYFGLAGAGGTVPVTASEPLASPAGVSAASVRAESVTVAPVASPSPAPAPASRVAAVVGSAVPSGPATWRKRLVAVAQGVAPGGVARV